MTGPMSSILAWWEGRTIREQRMLGVMALFVATVLAWLLVVRPAWSWRAEAAQARVAAESDLQMARRLASRAPRNEGPSTDLQAAVEAANAQLGLTPVMGMAPDGGLGFTLANAPTGAAFGWLAALHEKGVQASSLSVVENADATLTMEGSLAAN